MDDCMSSLSPIDMDGQRPWSQRSDKLHKREMWYVTNRQIIFDVLTHTHINSHKMSLGWPQTNIVEQSLPTSEWTSVVNTRARIERSAYIKSFEPHQWKGHTSSSIQKFIRKLIIISCCVRSVPFEKFQVLCALYWYCRYDVNDFKIIPLRRMSWGVW